MEQERKWVKIGPFSGIIVAEMIADVLKSEEIPCLLKKNWLGSAYGESGFNTSNEQPYILVDENYLEAAQDIAENISGEYEEPETDEADDSE